MYKMNEFHKQRHPDFLPEHLRTRYAIKNLGWMDLNEIAGKSSTIQLLAKLIALPASKRPRHITVETLDLLLHNLVVRFENSYITRRWIIVAWLVQSGQIKEDE